MPIIVNKGVNKPATSAVRTRETTPALLVAGVIVAVLIVASIFYFTLGKDNNSVSAEKRNERDQALKTLQSIPLPGQPGNTGAQNTGITTPNR